MGRPLRGRCWGGIARVGALAVGCLALAHCSGPFVSKEYSPRVVEEGEPVPKGGGAYKLGKPYNVNGRTYVPAENPHYRAEGIASWYGRDFHGRLTANGEVYDMHSISAAHTTLPMPCYVRVTNLNNGRSIVVRVNDRGPYHRDRVIDLSIGTAKALDFYHKGVARVRVEYVGRAPIEGSDDVMLMATLREGSPAPAPSKVMVAAAKPFIPKADDEAKAPVPAAPEPSYALASASSHPAKPVSLSEIAGGDRAKTKPAPRPAYASAVAPEAQSPPAASAPAPSSLPASLFGFAPTPPERGNGLGLMSGRGLY
jgi:peptidoglycan lytic transglycosylase